MKIRYRTMTLQVSGRIGRRVRLEEGVIGMLRKLSRKARGVHHGP